MSAKRDHREGAKEYATVRPSTPLQPGQRHADAQNAESSGQAEVDALRSLRRFRLTHFTAPRRQAEATPPATPAGRPPPPWSVMARMLLGAGKQQCRN